MLAHAVLHDITAVLGASKLSQPSTQIQKYHNMNYNIQRLSLFSYYLSSQYNYQISIYSSKKIPFVVILYIGFAYVSIQYCAVKAHHTQQAGSRNNLQRLLTRWKHKTPNRRKTVYTTTQTH